MSDNYELLFPTLSFPLNVYAQALLLEHEHVPYLHYGFFSASTKSLQEAQQNSTETLMQLLPDAPAKLLEVGIGLGTTARRLVSEGYQYTGITPDNHQILYCKRKHREHKLNFIHQYFEHFSANERYDVIVFQESAQYIDAGALLGHSHALLTSTGQVVIQDEIPAQFMQQIKPNLNGWGFELSYSEDVTQLAAPSITILCEVIEKHAHAVMDDLNIPESKLAGLLATLRRREQEYANGNYTYQLLKLDKLPSP